MNWSAYNLKRNAPVEWLGGVRSYSFVAVMILSVGLSGCHKKVQAVVLPQNLTPVALETPPTSESQALIEAPPAKVLPVPTASAASQPKRERRRPAKPAPVVVAPATPPAAPPTQVASAEGLGDGSNPIGALTAGSDAGPQAMQQATDLIASNEKRLKDLAAKASSAQQTQISKIKNFQRQAQDALKSGDAEGAKTLATKALLLLNDLDRGGGV